MTVSLDPKKGGKKLIRLKKKNENRKRFMRMPRAHNWFWIDSSNEIISRTRLFINKVWSFP